MKRTIILILVLFSLVSGARRYRSSASYSINSDTGLRLSLVFMEHTNVGFGAGIHSQMDLNPHVQFCPNVEVACYYGGEYYYNRYNWYRHSIIETTLNWDFRIHPARGRISPYLGLGLVAPEITYYRYEDYDYYEEYNDVNLAINFILGLDFSDYFFEIKEKAGFYNTTKLTFGMNF